MLYYEKELDDPLVYMSATATRACFQEGLAKRVDPAMNANKVRTVALLWGLVRRRWLP